MNRQTNQPSHNSSTQLYYSQYLKQQQVSPIVERFVGDEVQELRKQVEQLTKQLEFKEQMISEMRAHQKILMNRLSEPTHYQKDNVVEKIKEFEMQLKEKELACERKPESKVRDHSFGKLNQRPFNIKVRQFNSGSCNTVSSLKLFSKFETRIARVLEVVEKDSQ
ncbi:unnamed protein product (macronuclear) [Paramecium tetraurelia]|uniref:Uncharacterized protein n=1 Tax=Paramecium tetraurelia TaxID=5888 RepID=A0CPI3_PARTE|nr:uncharacterized protein GSPATT00009092001 [Paramecium tetraurelia]CAK72700.1 unnamed protein product [Paramecium tetraurelia]|eukprot:XP_001440097.1 hypothetical protein (macronuclear) [Paramecium tetraurelia strain d4-2]